MIKSFSFIKYFVDGFQSYINRYKDIDTFFLFDLEDSIQDIQDSSKTPALREYYRNILYKLLIENHITFPQKSGLRINSLSTTEFNEDIQLLKKLNNYHLNMILLPKVNSSKDIEHFLDIAEKNDIKFDDLGVVVETKTGMNNLKEILEFKDNKYKYVFFGCIDLNYDFGNCPFIHQNNPLFWNWTNHFSEMMTNSDKIFVNPPAFNNLTPQYYSWIIDKTYSLFQKEFYQVCIMFYQTLICHNYKLNTNFDPDLYYLKEEIDIDLYIRNLVRIVNEKNKNKGFSISSNSFITPHEYYTAQKYLSCLNENS